MKTELNKFADKSIEEVKLESIYDGSVIVLFTVVWDTLKTVKDVYDIVKMVIEVSELFIQGKLKETFRYLFRVDTYSLNFDCNLRYRQKLKVTEAIIPKRDAFFYYLLVSNIILIVIIGCLIFGAVMKVYF